MCGIVGAITERNVVPILLEGLRRLEYRGYDSAGLTVLDAQTQFLRCRRLGKVESLAEAIEQKKQEKTPIKGTIGIAHTRWATHGAPSEQNAHPHLSLDEVAIVHNGIIENFAALKEQILKQGFELQSDTDTEIVAHLLNHAYQESGDCVTAIRHVTNQLLGSYSLGIIFRADPEKLYAVRQGSPLVIGLGVGEIFIASDPHALRAVTTEVIYLEDGEIAECSRQDYRIIDIDNQPVIHQVHSIQAKYDTADRGKYRHYMLKEIFEQPTALENTLKGRITGTLKIDPVFSSAQQAELAKIERVHIVACGTSYHAGLVGRFWLEKLVNVPVVVDIASEYRYRNPVVESNTLFVTISQSGETADTLAALRSAKEKNYLNHLTICNVPESSLARESELSMMTAAGMEIGVASTKAFTTQLASLLLFSLILGKIKKQDQSLIDEGVRALQQLPKAAESILKYDHLIAEIAELFSSKQHALFLGRGIHYPIALEGALKLKEISYIHAEAYPAGELKHGPLALVDKEMPVIALAPNDHLIDKLKSNIEEVRARGGELFLFADKQCGIQPAEGLTLLDYDITHDLIAPIIHTIPLQLLAYHVAVLKGTDVDKPRNLAKSVTVE